ncbi:hypothetical protein C6A37_03915 [Desulfobacteraceae bacterium SEEP-SAG9]|nr:hypothetical protein C6A37_03915 [Desulfobacteraceae bacterium SEEP-SAG9]
MKLDKKCNMLADQIEEIFRKGLSAGHEELHYINSTFSNPSIEDLEMIIRDESNCETDPLLELLFFPDESIQIQLEDLLKSQDFQKKDEKAVAEYLITRKLKTTIHFPGTEDVLKLAIPFSAIVQFISRLNISRRPDKRITESISKFVRKEFRNLGRVKLRNSRFVSTENNVFFMCRFFEKIEDKNDDFFNGLGFVLNFLDGVREDRDLFLSLMDKKRFYLKSLQRAATFEAQLMKNNIETLMQQGLRAPLIDKDEARQKIIMIDKISLGIFGKTDYFGPEHNRVDISLRE